MNTHLLENEIRATFGNELARLSFINLELVRIDYIMLVDGKLDNEVEESQLAFINEAYELRELVSEQVFEQLKYAVVTYLTPYTITELRALDKDKQRNAYYLILGMIGKVIDSMTGKLV